MALNVGELVAVIDVDNRGWRRGLRAARRDFDGFTRDADGRLRDLQDRFAAEGDRSGSAFGRALSLKLIPTLGALAQAAGGVLPLLGRLGKALAVLGGAGVASVAVHALVGQLLALIGAITPAVGALAVLPAAGAAAAVGVTTLVVGLQGLGDAFKALASGDAEQFQQALADLSPAARQFVLQIHALSPAFTALRLDVQQRLFTGLGEVVRRLAERYLPVLRGNLAGVAGIINTQTRTAADVLGQPSTLTDVAAVLANIREAFTALTPAVAPVTAAMRDLVTVGSAQLPGLATAVTALAQRFAAFVSQARTSGQLAEFMQNGIDTVRELAGVLGGLARVVGDVLRAAQQAGGGFLATLNQALDAVHAFLSSATGQTALATFFASAAQATAALLPILLALGQVLATVVSPALADIGTTLLPGVQSLIEGLGSALQAIVPGLEAVFAAISEALPDLVPALTAIGKAIGKAFTALAPAIGPVVRAFSALVSAVAPLLPLAADLFGQVLAAAAPIITRVAVALTPVVQTLADQLRPLIPQIAAAFAQLLAAVAPVITAFVSALAPVLPTLVQAWLALIQALMPLAPIVAGVATAVLSMIPLLLQIRVFLLNLAAAILGPVISAITRLIGWFATFGQATKVALTIVRQVASGIQSAIGGMATWAITRITVLLSVFTGLPGRVAGLAAAMTSAGLRVMSALFRGLTSGLGKAGDFLAGVGKTIVNAVIDVLNIPIKALKSALDFDIRIPIPGVPDPTISIRLGSMIPTIRHLARGGVFGPGLALVGEEGPELVAFTGRGRVHNARDTSTMLTANAPAGGGGGGGAGVTPAQLVDAVRAGVLAALEQARVSIDAAGVARLVAAGNLRLARRT